MPVIPMEAANATSSVLVFLDSRFDTDNERAVRNDMDGFLMPDPCGDDKRI